jgi:hypothetical protein
MSAGKLELPESVRQQFVVAGRKGWKKAKDMFTSEDRKRWGKLGGRPKKDRSEK